MVAKGGTDGRLPLGFFSPQKLNPEGKRRRREVPNDEDATMLLEALFLLRRS